MSSNVRFFHATNQKHFHDPLGTPEPPTVEGANTKKMFLGGDGRKRGIVPQKPDPTELMPTSISLLAHISPSSGLISNISSAKSIRSFPSALRRCRYLRFRAACAACKLGGSSTVTADRSFPLPARTSPEDTTTAPDAHSSFVKRQTGIEDVRR